MIHHNNDNPLLDECKIFDYFIWAYTLDNADTTEITKKSISDRKTIIMPHIINGTNYYL